MSKCVECQFAPAVAPDPRVPPLEHDECLCVDCGESAYDERIEELREEVKTLRQERRALRRKKKS